MGGATRTHWSPCCSMVWRGTTAITRMPQRSGKNGGIDEIHLHRGDRAPDAEACEVGGGAGGQGFASFT